MISLVKLAPSNYLLTHYCLKQPKNAQGSPVEASEQPTLWMATVNNDQHPTVKAIRFPVK